jgi:uncharacterized protein YndB with AHSA1/START domain
MNSKTQIIAENGKHDFLIIREFAATKEKIFNAFSNPDLFKEWFMPKEMGLTIKKMECLTGGSFAYSHKHPNGMQFSFQGVYHEVKQPDLIIKTSEFVGLPQKVLPVLEVTTFEDLENGNTKVTIHSFCPSCEYRDAMIQNGMEEHLQISYQLLDNILAQ